MEGVDSEIYEKHKQKLFEIEIIRICLQIILKYNERRGATEHLEKEKAKLSPHCQRDCHNTLTPSKVMIYNIVK